MRSRRVALTAIVALLVGLVTAVPVAAAPEELAISEVRIDQPDTDTDEYAEIAATPGASLDGVTYLVIGDGEGGSGVIEAVVSLDGITVPDDGVVVVAEGSFTLGTPDVVADLNFENSDNVTHVVVDGFTGSDGDDLDTDDDGTLDATPWTTVLDAVSLVETPTGGDQFYAGTLGLADVGPDGSFVPGHVFIDRDGVWQIGEFTLGETDTPGVFPNEVAPPPPPTCDAGELTLISAVQGAGFSSPLDGQQVVVEGAVTAVYPELGGITVQEEPADADADPATSDGVFVFLGFGFDDTAYDRLDIVQVTGEVEERFGNTQIDGDAVVCDAEPVEIAATPLTLPADDATREALEGVLVETTQDLTVTSLFTAYRFGELGVSSSGILRQPSDVFEPGSPQALALEASNADDLLFIDDRGEFGDDNDPWFGAPGDRAGDTVEAGVTGVLVFSFGDYLLEPVGAFPEVVDSDVAFADREPAPELAGGNDIGAFNVLNYFNTFGDSAVLRGAQSQEQFDIQSAKIVDAIISLDAAVLGLIELENDYEDLYDGDPSTQPSIQTLVDQLNANAGAGTYDWIRVPESLLTAEGLGGGGLGTDAIAVGIIYQPALATPVGEAAAFDIDALLGGADPDNNRWPLAHSFEIDRQVVTVVVNHFKSKGSPCDDTVVPDGFGDGQNDPQTGSCDLVREYAAERLIEWIETKPTGVRSPDAFVVGDLNAYGEEDPIRIFTDAGYRDVVERYDDTFTFKFDGRFGRLDYILASPSAKRLVDDAAVWHANAPEPYGYLYFNEPIDLTGYASSDHDPVVVAISQPGRGRPRR
ncbi:MAG: ExeM/NucH family extracellular endonuclease [Actinobacteria bacterium]|nr:ExeM/NucH family extracellular endonuclease [Actinomycetota bacterium]